MNCTGKNCIMQYDKVDPATCPCVPYCPQATPPKTNGDKIRQMNDVELANYLDSVQFFGYLAGKDDTQLIHVNIYEWFEWLKEEVEDGST